MDDPPVETPIGVKGSFPLWCPVCKKMEFFTPGQIERILWSMHGALHDHTMSPLEPDIREYHAEYCWKTHYFDSLDVEMYAEHVNSYVESRLWGMREIRKERKDAARKRRDAEIQRLRDETRRLR